MLAIRLKIRLVLERRIFEQNFRAIWAVAYFVVLHMIFSFGFCILPILELFLRNDPGV